MNYFNLLKESYEENKKKDFFIINEEKYTYEDVYDECINIERYMEEVNEGDNSKVLIYCEHTYLQLINFFAVSKNKRIPIIAHYNLPEEALRKIVLKNNVGWIISEREVDFSDYNEQDFKGTYISKIKQIEANKINRKLYLYKIHNIDEDFEQDNVCMGVLTSGSTGIPKVLFRTYESWAGFFDEQNKVFDINKESRIFINGSLSFTGNLNVIVSVLYEGGTIVSSDTFDSRKWKKIIKENNVTNIYLVPVKIKMLLKVVKEPILTVKNIFTGSQLLIKECAQEIKRKFPLSEIILYYGASELNYITYINYKNIKDKPLSVGKPFNKVKVFIKDGYIYVDTAFHVEGMKSPCTVYDIGYFDEDNFLIFQGRSGDMVNKGGFKISTLKVEEEISKIPEVKGCAVIPYDEDERGRNIAAFIECDKELSKEDIQSFLKRTLMKEELPKKIILIDKLPLNTSGKIDKLSLKCRL